MHFLCAESLRACLWQKTTSLCRWTLASQGQGLEHGWCLHPILAGAPFRSSVLWFFLLLSASAVVRASQWPCFLFRPSLYLSGQQAGHRDLLRPLVPILTLQLIIQNPRAQSLYFPFPEILSYFLASVRSGSHMFSICYLCIRWDGLSPSKAHLLTESSLSNF